MSFTPRLFSLVAVLALGACTDPDSSRLLEPDVSLAKGGGTTTDYLEYTIANTGVGLGNDGKGTYRHGVCGVVGTWSSGAIHLGPAEGRIPKSQTAACAGIAPRAATLVLASKHISDSPHVDDTLSPPGSGTFAVGNVKFGTGTAQATTINSTARCGTAGLRFTPVTYPGTDNVIREDLGGGLWHMYTQAWPNNRAYCSDGTTVSYWHVSLDITLQILP